MSADLQQLYAHHAVGLCPEERCVTARANLAALVEALPELRKSVMTLPYIAGGGLSVSRKAVLKLIDAAIAADRLRDAADALMRLAHGEPEEPAALVAAQEKGEAGS
jgi:hypothetical protein